MNAPLPASQTRPGFLYSPIFPLGDGRTPYRRLDVAGVSTAECAGRIAPEALSGLAFQAVGGTLVMLAKGNRSKAVRESCKRNGGFYLGSVGGPAARLVQDCIRKVEVLEYLELGMEVVWRIEVEDFPAFIVIDDKGNDFYDGLE